MREQNEFEPVLTKISAFSYVSSQNKEGDPPIHSAVFLSVTSDYMYILSRTEGLKLIRNAWGEGL